MNTADQQQASLNHRGQQDKFSPQTTQPNNERQVQGPLKQEIKPCKKRGRPTTRFSKVDEIKMKAEEIKNETILEETCLEVNDEASIKKIEKTIKEGDIITSFTIQGENNVMKILLRKQSNRMVKMEFQFNDVVIKPTTFNGMSSAMNFWNVFKSTIR